MKPDSTINPIKNLELKSIQTMNKIFENLKITTNNNQSKK